MIENDKKIITAMIIILLAMTAAVLIYNIYNTNFYQSNVNHWENDLGNVDKSVYGNNNSSTELVLIAGIHPREPLAIEPEIEAARQFAENHDVKFTVYHVNVTNNPTDYQESRDQGESLVHDFVVPDISHTDAKAVIISHSHVEGYGEGYYLATPAMDSASVDISEKIVNSSDFKYYPRNVSQPIEATSAKLVSIPIADAGYPTFVYEIPENITDQDSTDKTIELFGMIYDIVRK